MRKTLILATLFLGILSGQAQEKVMNVQKTDGTTSQTRVTDLKQISFLAVDAGDQGLVVKTLGGEKAAVLFEANPVVTIANGKLVIKPSTGNTLRYEISDIAEIVFDNATPISEVKGFSFVVQDGGAVLRNIPSGIVPRIYSIDGRCLPTPPFRDGELRLNCSSLGKGIYIVKVGSFSTKIQLH